MNRKRIITWEDPRVNKKDATESTCGLDYLKAIRDGKISPPPVASLVGYKIREVDFGFAVFELNPAEYHYNPFETVHGGILSTLLDTSMTASILSTLPGGVYCPTIDIKISLIKPVTEKTGILHCEGKPIDIGNRLAVAEGWLKDENDKLYAHGTCTCAIKKGFPL